MKNRFPASLFLVVFIIILIPAGIAAGVFCAPSRFTLFLEFIRDDVRKPLRRSICLTAAKVDYSGRKNKCISRADLREIRGLLKPGDILFRRSEGQLTNIAISGFWTHSAIYIGGKDELNNYFGGLSITGGMKPSDYIEQNYPAVSGRLGAGRHMVIEAVGEGVVINSVNHFANTDYFSGVRPVAGRDSLFRIILAAFDNFGKPYDFFFDFQNDDSFFCSELVYKSLEKAGMGNRFFIPQKDGEPFMTPNDIALQTTENNGSPFQLVVFYCADEQMKKAERKCKSEFRLFALEQ